jgi:hypothetical protein
MKKKRVSISLEKLFYSAEQKKLFRALTGSHHNQLFDPTWYRDRYQEVAARGVDPLRHYIRRGVYEGRAPHPLFDPLWYTVQYEDVAQSGQLPLLHYLQYGVHEWRSPHPLFDAKWYIKNNIDIIENGFTPLDHYLRYGYKEGRQPNPFFDPAFYLRANPDVEAAGLEPLSHFISSGAREGRNPSPYFDTKKYSERHPEVYEKEINPLVHYLASDNKFNTQYVKIDAHSRPETAESDYDLLSRSGLFNSDFYLEAYPDVALAGADPLAHYLSSGYTEGRNPNRLFSSAWYARQNDLPPTKNPLIDYLLRGAAERRDPHPNFSIRKYLNAHPDVAESGVEPLFHFLNGGVKEARQIFPSDYGLPISDEYTALNEVTASALSRMREDGITQFNPQFGFQPLNIEVDSALGATPSLLIILPGLNRRYATGGPNTAYILGCLLAAEGVSVKFVSNDAPPDTDLGPLKKHLSLLTGLDLDELGVEFLDAHARDNAFKIGCNDVFMATAWWTAQPAKAATAFVNSNRFLYLIQDYESMFYGLSVMHAVAKQTYSYNFLPIVNSSLLRDHLAEEKVGRFAEPAFVSNALCFEPAVDTNYFYPDRDLSQTHRRLLFYTRPTMADRNLFALGVASLRAAVTAGLFGEQGWEFIGMGEHFEPIALGKGFVLKPAPWLDFSGYGALLRSADVLLSLMLSPHPSYPPLEVAACGGIVVTTEFGAKTAERMAKISPNIIAVPATLEDLVPALVRAVGLRERQKGSPNEITPLPRTWVESLSAILPRLLQELAKEGISGRNTSIGKTRTQAVRMLLEEKSNRSISTATSISRHVTERRRRFRNAGDGPSLTIVSALEQVDGLFELASAILGQESEISEWIIIDRTAQVQELTSVINVVDASKIKIIRAHDSNSIHALASVAIGDYLVLINADGIPTIDAFKTIRAFLQQSGEPPAIVADDYDARKNPSLTPMMRTGWDEPLSAFQSVSPGLIAFKRDCVPKRRDEGAHDEASPADILSFARSAAHLPEVLWLRTRGENTRANASKVDGQITQSRSFPVISLKEEIILKLLKGELAKHSKAEIVHLRSELALGETGDATQEVHKIFELFPDALIVGGPIEGPNGAMLEGPIVFGYGELIGYPEVEPDVPTAQFDPITMVHVVNAVSARCCWVNRALLERELDEMPEKFSAALIGPWLGAAATRSGGKVIYAPRSGARMRAETNSSRTRSIAAQLAERFFLREKIQQKGYAAQLDASGQRPYSLRLEPIKPLAALPYRDILEQRERDSRASFKEIGAARSKVGVLSTVYIKTDPQLFRATVASVTSQILNAAEWIILANGPVSPEVDGILREIATDRQLSDTRTSQQNGLEIVVLSTPVNLGIHGGLRVCLENATSEYVTALDADDLLTQDAIALIEKELEKSPDEIFYTDEDLYVDGRPVHPFYRSDYDPVQLRAHSSIWHSIVFKRETGLRLGVYSSHAVEYALDWDTLLRFEINGFAPRHIPRVIYHWRQHKSSLSNSGSVFEGSLKSVRSSLEYIRSKMPDPELYQVSPYPCNMGMPDFFLERRKTKAPMLSWVVMGSEGELVDVPFGSVRRLELSRGTLAVERLGSALRAMSDEFVCLLGPGVRLWDLETIWQAVRHFEMVPAVAGVSGPVTRETGEIVLGAAVQTGVREYADPYAGRSMLDRGAEMMSFMKPCCVSAVYSDLLVARREALVNAICEAPNNLAMRSLGLWFGIWAARNGTYLVYEPLLRGRAQDDARLISDPAEVFAFSLDVCRQGASIDGRGAIRGHAAIVAARHVHPK